MTSENEIHVDIRGIVPTPSGSGVFLGNGDKSIAIFVDPSVAAAISMFLQKVKKPRPLTHDLIGNLFTGLGVKVRKVVINDLQEDTYFARIYLLQENELGRSLIEIDARPSDSIAIAIQQSTPVFVTQAVWERAEDMSWALEQVAHQEEGAEDDLPFAADDDDYPDLGSGGGGMSGLDDD